MPSESGKMILEAGPIESEVVLEPITECSFDQTMLHMGTIIGEGITLGMYGAAEGAIHGAIDGSAGDGAIIGTAVFGTLGLGIGVFEAVRDYEPLPCIPS